MILEPNIAAHDVSATVAEVGSIATDIGLYAVDDDALTGVRVGACTVQGLVGTRIEISLNVIGAQSLVALLTEDQAEVLIDLLIEATGITPVAPVLQ